MAAVVVNDDDKNDLKLRINLGVVVIEVPTLLNH